MLLDTDACIEVIRGNPRPVEAFPDRVFRVSEVSRFELLSGLRGQADSRREERALAFLEAATVVPLGAEAARRAAGIRIALEANGERIGAYDLLVAGQAIALGAGLVTGNLREFCRVPGLEVCSWA